MTNGLGVCQNAAVPKKVLAIDDDEAFILLLHDAFEAAGHEFKSARDGKDGLRIAREFKPDIVLLDLMMPGMHGYEVASSIREDKALSGAKIIVISAKGYQFDKNAAKAAGADEYLVKPFRIPDLFALLPQ